MIFAVETEQEDDARWLAEVPQISGVLAYGTSRNDAIFRAEALALRVLADRLEHDDGPQKLGHAGSGAT